MGSSWIIWLMVLLASLGAAVFGVSTGQPDVLALIMSVVATLIAGWAVCENWHMTGSGASPSAIASANSRHMGLVWSLGALALLVTYTQFLEWKEWLTFTSAFGAVAVLCVGFSAMTGHDGAAAESETGEDALLKLARYLTIAQLVGMIATMIGLVVDGKMPASAVANPGWYDWAGNIIFFYGALALTVISANALYTQRNYA